MFFVERADNDSRRTSADTGATKGLRAGSRPEALLLRYRLIEQP